MLNKNEIMTLNLSPTKKDFVQIWNELLEVAGKLSERWDPTSTNESDPGIVILKAITGIADKLNYNIDKNILEAFMPTAAQEDSMRKLCDMLGYTMKYYRSAETMVNIKYFNSDPSDDEAEAMSKGLYIPKFTIVTDSDRDISYFTTNKSDIYISSESPSVSEIPCMEGQLIKCTSINDTNVITVNQISENNRFYLPEVYVAENGIFVYNVASSLLDGGKLVDGTEWTRVDNLNIRARGTKVFKFGYDSYESRPYIEFPEDYSKLFGDGLFIYYARTKGVTGNISTRVLTQLELPTSSGWDKVSTESFSVENVFSATSGANPETMRQAYSNFKKTIGTFETLVTCRDYMNKIYSLVNERTGKPIVSNILVTDIRSDLNRAKTICSCDNAGIFYKEVPFLSSNIVDTITETIGNETIVTKVVEKEQAINHFDLVFYPYKSYNQINNYATDIKAVYDSSFTYANSTNDIVDRLKAADIKNMAHNIKTPREGDLLSINNYLRITATIATNSKVTEAERAIIIQNIKIALANAFNMRELDFGDEIPFDSLVSVIESADSRIRVASLNEPAVYTTFSVLGHSSSKVPNIIEYAVASDWLDVDMADSTGRFDIKDIKRDSTGKIISYTSDTFNSEKARKTYNDLVVRNILAGRVSLFKYNNTFDTNFSESPYLVTSIIPIKPANLAEPTEDNPFTIWTENNIVYTGQLVYDQQTDTKQVIYTETKSPSELDEIIEDNVIKESVDNSHTTDLGENSNTSNSGGSSDNPNLNSTSSSTATNDYITNIRTSCKLFTDEYDTIEDVTLSDGEFVRFRAPNFITSKTYPAYVNYNLSLNTALKSKAIAAEASSLFSILDADRESWSTSNTNINWQKVIDYFKNVDKNFNTSYIKTFTLAQTVSAFKEFDEESKPGTSDINILGIDVNNTSAETAAYTVDQLVALSGCVKLTNKNFKGRISWTPADGEVAPEENVPVEVDLSKLANPYITSSAVLEDIMEAVNSSLATYRDTLPKNCSWTVYFDFECVPFEAKSLAAWEKFVSTCALYYSKNYAYQVFNYKPVSENETFLWRSIGEGYEIGKYVTDDFNKLLRFNKNYFNLLPAVPLQGIYIVKNIGADAEPSLIMNNEEYKLRNNEYLYIEYTPSNTAGDGEASKQVITEVYEAGTIIRPSGFDLGLMDSSTYSSMGNTYNKSVVFSDVGQTPVNLFSLGASEQIEIRDLAKVELSKNTVSNTTSCAYIYKNFDCSELQDYDTDAEGNRINNTYTLKDGEYIFYTDYNQADFAYYTSGTQVTLEGKITLPVCDNIELSTIFDSGIQEIPWVYKTLESNDKYVDKIIFQEYQYLTLGPGDTIKNLVLSGTSRDNIDYTLKYLDETWQYCDEVKYVVADDPSTIISLPNIDISNSSGNGWEASSTLELAVAPDSAQALRRTDKLETSLILSRTSTTGGSIGEYVIRPASSDLTDFTTSLPLYFKTNVNCLSCGHDINISNVYSNPNNAKGFQVEVFSMDPPVFVKTRPGTVAPKTDYTLLDIATWTGEPLTVNADSSQDIWNKVALSKLKVANNLDTANNFDTALRLSINVLKDTYGLFSIYLDGQDEDLVWIETLPGTEADTITLMNTGSYIGLDSNNRLYLRQGINCIRVRKSCKLFIKASSNSDSILYFDKPKLVNSKRLEYKNANGNLVSLYTNGLNLAQLGYLDVHNHNNSIMDEVTRSELHKAYIDQAAIEIDEVFKNTESDISDKYKSIADNLNKVQSIVDFENAVDSELANIKSMDPNRLTEISLKYREINDDLGKEKSLLAAINNNVKADEIERKLAVLLASLSEDSSAQQQILKDLATLKSNVYTLASQLPDSSIIEEYNSHAAIHDASEQFAEITSVAANLIEKNYQDNLSALVENLNQVINSDTRSNLMSILESLRNSEISPTQIKLFALINRLNTVLEQESINSIIDEMFDAAMLPDYTRLYTLVNTLSGLLETRGLSTVISDLNQVASELSDSNSGRLKELCDELNTLVNQIGAIPEGSIQAIIAELSTRLQSKINTGDMVYDHSITNNVTNIQTAFMNDYKDQLENISKSINECLGDLQMDTPIKMVIELINSLEGNANFDNPDSKVNVIINNIIKTIYNRNDYLGELSRLTESELGYRVWELEALNIKNFIRDAIVIVWPTYLSSRVTDLLTSVDNVFATAINGDLNTFDDMCLELQNLFDYTKNLSITPTIVSIIDIEKFSSLLNTVKSLISSRIQSDSDKKLITEISGLIEDSKELTGALKNPGTNIMLDSLLQDWKNADDVIQKQELQSALKEELSNIIDQDEKLLEAITDMLCPSIEKYLTELDPNELFYDKFLRYISAIKQVLITSPEHLGMSSVANIILDTPYLDLIKLSLADFKNSLLTFSNPADSLLPDIFIANINEVKDIYSNLEHDIDVLSQYTNISELTSNDIDEIIVNINDINIKDVLTKFKVNLEELENTSIITPGYEDIFYILRLEDQLLEEIRHMDTNREFYYNAPIENRLAIEFNESDKKLNTLMNPIINYDINNIANNFVISKLDIGYLDNGVQIARSSRVS